MRCDEARDCFWPPDRPEALTPEVMAARRHVESCEACREYLSQDPALLRAYRVLRAERAPGVVRRRIFDGLQEESRGKGRGVAAPGVGGRPRRGMGILVPKLALAAGTLGLVLLPTLYPGSEDRPDFETPPAASPGAEAPLAAPGEGGSAFVEDFLRRAVQMERIDAGRGDHLPVPRPEALPLPPSRGGRSGGPASSDTLRRHAPPVVRRSLSPLRGDLELPRDGGGTGGEGGPG